MLTAVFIQEKRTRLVWENRALWELQQADMCLKVLPSFIPTVMCYVYLTCYQYYFYYSSQSSLRDTIDFSITFLLLVKHGNKSRTALMLKEM